MVANAFHYDEGGEVRSVIPEVEKELRLRWKAEDAQADISSGNRAMAGGIGGMIGSAFWLTQLGAGFSVLLTILFCLAVVGNGTLTYLGYRRGAKGRKVKREVRRTRELNAAVELAKLNKEE